MKPVLVSTSAYSVIIYLGKLLCLLPCQNNMEDEESVELSVTNNKYRLAPIIRKIISYWKSIIITGTLIINALLLWIDSRNFESPHFSKTTLKLINIVWPMYMGHTTFLYIFFLVKSKQFISIFKMVFEFQLSYVTMAKEQEIDCDNGSKQDEENGKKYFKSQLGVRTNSANFWSGLPGITFTGTMMMLTALETICYDIRLNYSEQDLFQIVEKRHNLTTMPLSFSSPFESLMQKMYLTDFKQIKPYVDYNFYIMTALYIIIKLATFAICYANVVAVVICGLLEEHFQKLRHTIEGAILMSGSSDAKITSSNYTQYLIKTTSTGTATVDKVPWEKFHMEYLRLKELANKTSNFLSLLLVATYAINLTTMVSSVFQWLEKFSNIHDYHQSLYKYASFVYFLVRIFVVTYWAAQVNISAEKIGQVIAEQPGLPCSWPMYRFEQMTSREKNPPGIYIFGTFLITRNTFLSLISVTLTTQIVLLQIDPSRF